MQLIWNQCQGDVWCNLNTVNLTHSHFDNKYGIYIIWHGGQNAATVYVGQGNIRERLTEHRSNANIQAYASLNLYVTWADVQEAFRDGVERYLAERIKPKVGAAYPSVSPIEVNLPWK